MAVQPPDLSTGNERTRLRRLTRYVQELVADVARLPELPPADVGLFDLGIESLHAVEVKGILEVTLGLFLDDTLLIDEPTINGIVALLDERLREAVIPVDS
jgi:acyl carrier protein